MGYLTEMTNKFGVNKVGIVKGICISEKKGTKKILKEEAEFIENWGIKEDAHGGDWHRQISILSYEKIEEFRKKGAKVELGAFGENLIIEGFDFRSYPVGTYIYCGDIVLEITQIGKECHTHCAIYHQMGECIMPIEGVFAVVKKGGKLKIGDEVSIDIDKAFQVLTAAVLTLSDSGYHKERIDESGQAIVEILTREGYHVVERVLLPDDQKRIEDELKRLSDQRQVHLILTTGGTGFSERDITPEATMAVATKNAQGIAEAIRSYSMQITRRSMLSRGVSVIRNKTLIVNLPGSKKAVLESMEAIMTQLKHGIAILRGTERNCGDGKR